MASSLRLSCADIKYATITSSHIHERISYHHYRVKIINLLSMNLVCIWKVFKPLGKLAFRCTYILRVLIIPVHLICRRFLLIFFSIGDCSLPTCPTISAVAFNFYLFKLVRRLFGHLVSMVKLSVLWWSKKLLPITYWSSDQNWFNDFRNHFL